MSELMIDYRELRAPKADSSSEVIRLMPRGVRDALLNSAPDELSDTIRTWCTNRGLITASRRRGEGRLRYTTLGKAVVRQLNQRMKGYR